MRVTSTIFIDMKDQAEASLVGERDNKAAAINYNSGDLTLFFHDAASINKLIAELEKAKAMLNEAQ